MRFESLHLAARRSVWLARLTVVTRILLAVGFIPTGLVKVLGHRFTVLGTETPVGAFFEALYQTGTYWQFLGWTQVIAGVLVLVPRTACLGALLFLAIMANIFVITLSLPFAGTPLVTGLMLAAVAYLVCWDFHCWKRIISHAPPHEPPPPPARSWQRLEHTLLGLGTAAGLVFFLSTRSLCPPAPGLFGLGIAALLAPAVLVVWVLQDRRQKPTQAGAEASRADA
jgi:uncharacterized membrane protein YphA (DoxX/SURF4 family)